MLSLIVGVIRTYIRGGEGSIILVFSLLKYKIVIMLNVLFWKCPCRTIQIVLEEGATEISWESWSAWSAKGYKWERQGGQFWKNKPTKRLQKPLL